PTQNSTLSLHDALPISKEGRTAVGFGSRARQSRKGRRQCCARFGKRAKERRSDERRDAGSRRREVNRCGEEQSCGKRREPDKQSDRKSTRLNSSHVAIS